MAPLTRCRATPGTFVPNEMMAKHYADRATAGLLIAEATVISEEARGFPNTPGCYNAAQVRFAGLCTSARPHERAPTFERFTIYKCLGLRAHAPHTGGGERFIL